MNTKQTRADIVALQVLQDSSALDLRAVMSYTMRYCGCTYTEIGEVFNITRQQAKNVVDNVKISIAQL
jgi:hypothetical protein